jgi:hypothetical protein
MRMLLENGSTDTFSSIMANDIPVYVSFSIMVATTGLVYYLLARILDWSSYKPLPRIFQSSAFNVLFVGSIMAIAILLLRGIDLIGLFAKVGKSVVCGLVVGYAPVVAVGLASAVTLIVVRRRRRLI